jgi:hypothetical protein
VDRAAAGGGGARLSQEQLAAMTIPGMKAWLTQRGFEQEAWVLSTRRPAAKKGDWVALVSEKAGAL